MEKFVALLTAKTIFHNITVTLQSYRFITHTTVFIAH